ncbi:MAG: transporter substrate-binding domain-containing protein [Desulfohalobiaceae bacterium]|nr:transporter substrate-binding domain-containing protein [Desulfohalobiaceae bacterium]
MKHRLVSFVLASSLFLAAPAFGQPEARPAGSQDKAAYAFAGITKQKFTGDFDGMLKRRLIRVLVTYSKTHYFVDRAAHRGLTYEIFRLFEDSLNKKLKKNSGRVHVVFVPVARDELIPALLDGKGDIAAANLTITPKRLKQVDFSNSTIKNVSEIVITAPGTAPISTLTDLSGKEIYIRKSSSYYESIENLNASLIEDGRRPVKVRLAPEELEDEDILEMVNAGLVKRTVVDRHIAEFWKRVFKYITLHPRVAVRTGADIGIMTRKDSPRIQEELNRFLAAYPEGSKTRNILFQKYLRNTDFVKSATSREGIAKFKATVDFFRKYAEQYGLDYPLLIAMGYQESRLDQKARNPSGAIGVMQVLPSTAKDMNVGDITKLENNIHAGVKYIRFLMNQFYANEPMEAIDKGLFTFASYNAGPGRISRLRKDAALRGLDPCRWFNHVEVLAAERIGQETVQYVSSIFKYYLAYKMVLEQRREREKTKLKEKKRMKQRNRITRLGENRLYGT